MLSLSVAVVVTVPPRSPTKEVAPGVHMPVLSLGTCCGSNPSVGVVPWLTNGGVGIDTAWDYFDQKAVGQGILKSGVNRSSVFVLTKVPPVVDALAKVGGMPREQADATVTDWQIKGKYNVEVW